MRLFPFPHSLEDIERILPSDPPCPPSRKIGVGKAVDIVKNGFFEKPVILPKKCYKTTVNY